MADNEPRPDQPSRETLPSDLGKPMDSEEIEDPVAKRLAEIDEAIRQARAETRLPEPPGQEELSAKLDENMRRLKRAREQAFKGTARDPKTLNSGLSGRTFGVGISAAYNLVGCVLGFWIIGFLIDRAVGTQGIWQAVLTLIGAIAGMIGTLLIILRTGGPRKR